MSWAAMRMTQATYHYDNPADYRARYYDPTIGRFISEDPLGFAGNDVNLYRYVYDDPVNLTDPSGQAAAGAAAGGTLGGVIGGVVGGVAGGTAGAAGGTIALPGGGTIAGGAAGTVEGVAVGTGVGITVGAIIGSAIEDFSSYFSKGGKQNIANEFVDQARAMFGNDRDAICKWLDGLYQKASPAQRLKIKVAQKFFGCRRSCGGGN